MRDTAVVASANVELVRSIWAAWQRGDWSSAPWADADIHYEWVGGPSPGVWTGLASMAEAWKDFLNAWEDLRAEVEEFRELDDERVLVLAHFIGHGKTSGLDLGELHTGGASVYQVRNGKVARIVFYFDRQRAFAELGLTPDVE
jgi:ketosteroid isomerase-like protein